MLAGLEFLAENNYVHRDIAARNCMGKVHAYVHTELNAFESSQCLTQAFLSACSRMIVFLKVWLMVNHLLRMLYCSISLFADSIIEILQKGLVQKSIDIYQLYRCFFSLLFST